MMKRIDIVVLLIYAAIALSGCEAIFTFNLFSAFDTPRTPSAESFDAMSTAELLTEVARLLETETFLSDIAENDELRRAVVENLKEVYADGSKTSLEEQQQAALFVAEIELNTTTAGQVVDDFVKVLTEYGEGASESDGAEGMAETLVKQLFSTVTEENFDETLDALLAAAEAFTFYGESLGDSGAAAVPEGVNSGAVAQDAFVAIFISEIVDVEGDRPELLDIEELKSVVLRGEPFPGDFVIDDNPVEENQALANILRASDLEGLFTA